MPRIIPLSRDFFTTPIRQRTLYYSFLKRFLYYSDPTEDFLLFLSQKMFYHASLKRFLYCSSLKGFLYCSSLIGFLYDSSLKGFLYYSNPTTDSLLFHAREIPLLLQPDKRILYDASLKRFLYDSNPAADSLLFLSQKIPLLFQSNRGLFTIPLSKDSFYCSSLKRFLDCSSLKRLLYYSSLKGFLYCSSLKGLLYYSSPTKDSLPFLSQRISLLFRSDAGFFTIHFSKDFLTIPIRQRILYYSSLKGFVYYSRPTKDSFLI